MDIFGGRHETRQLLWVISMHFRVLSEGQGTEWKYFLVFLFIFTMGVKPVDTGSKPTCQEQIRVPQFPWLTQNFMSCITY